MFPDPGSVWFRPERDGAFTVNNVDLKRGILLVGNTGQGVVRVPAHGWPGTWMLVPGESETPEGEVEHHAFRTFVAGGEEGRQHIRVRRILMEEGFDAEDHAPGFGSRMPGALPKDTEVVVLLISHLGHDLYDLVKLLAQKRGLPILLASSNTLRTDLRKERERLGLAPKPPERMGGLPMQSDGWWTYGPDGREWTTEASAILKEDEAAYREDSSPAVPSISPGEDGLASLALVGLGLAVALRA